jgi:hypothetical protein
MVVVLSLAPVLRAKDDLAGEISCQAYGIPERQNQPCTKKLWDGYEISLGPTRNSQGGGDECTAAIYSQRPKPVSRSNQNKNEGWLRPID